MKCEPGHILTYYDGSEPQFTNLRASMLAYAHINLLSMLQRFEPEEAVRVATDSIYKSAFHKLEGVKAYVAPKRCDCGEAMCMLCLLEEDYLPPVAPGLWRDKGEQIFMPQEHAAYLAKPDYICSEATKKDLTPSTAPRHDDPLSRHRLSYLNGGGGIGKTRERSSSSVPETPSSSPRPTVWRKRCRPGASRPRPITASSAGVARQTGRPKGLDRSSFPM